jgi:hypothetical protein
MRAKLKVTSVLPWHNGDGQKASERLSFCAVYKNGNYPEDGTDEDNTFAKWTPSALLDMQVNNPQLFEQFKPGDTFYVDFSPVPQP